MLWKRTLLAPISASFSLLRACVGNNGKARAPKEKFKYHHTLTSKCTHTPLGSHFYPFHLPRDQWKSKFPWRIQPQRRFSVSSYRLLFGLHRGSRGGLCLLFMKSTEHTLMALILNNTQRRLDERQLAARFWQPQAIYPEIEHS